jgi:hydrogenase-1 operon protein HyaF
MSDQDRISVVNIVGPGSQPEENDGKLDYLPMPSVMSTFTNPAIPEPEEIGDCKAALDLLEKVLLALQEYPAASATLFDLAELNGESTDFVNQLLGIGEVSISVDGDAPIEIQESVMAGLWRIHHRDTTGRLLRDYLEVAPVPGVVVQSAFQSAQVGVQTDIDKAREGIVNSPALLAEIDEKIRQLQPDSPPHVINLSLLPLSPEDLIFLGERLGVGPVTILSRGYGNCRIGSTACHSTWWIKYYNSEDALIMNTIEIVDVPEVVLAAPEDLTDSAERLHDILELYR